MAKRIHVIPPEAARIFGKRPAEEASKRKGPYHFQGKSYIFEADYLRAKREAEYIDSKDKKEDRGVLPDHGFGGQVSRRKSDTVYLWQVRDENIYKVGVSTYDRVWDRISEVAKRARLDGNVITACEVDTELCLRIENFLLSLGKPIDAGKVDGHSEFRHFDDFEVEAIVAVMRHFAKREL